MQVELTGKTAIVTGAASGVGLAIVKQFLASGLAHLVAVDLAPPPPELQALLDQHPRTTTFVQGDVGREETAQQFASAGLALSGRIDILVNNAGVALVKAIHEHTPEEWDFIMNTNVKALYFAARHVVPTMLAQKTGVILNTGSISGHVGIIGQGAYGPSKGALHQMTRQMAVEYAPHGIRVNAVALGTVDTPIVQQSAREFGDPAAFWKMLRDNHPIGRVAQADEVACFFTYLARLGKLFHRRDSLDGWRIYRALSPETTRKKLKTTSGMALCVICKAFTGKYLRLSRWSKNTFGAEVFGRDPHRVSQNSPHPKTGSRAFFWVNPLPPAVDDSYECWIPCYGKPPLVSVALPCPR